MLFGIVIFPPKEVQDAANTLRRRFDPHYGLIPPHLTVREAEDWDDAMLEKAVLQLAEAAAKLEPVTVTLNRYSTFFPVSNVVYMAVEDPEPLVRIHQAVCSGPLAAPQRNYTYTPHVTIAQQVGDDEMHDIYASLRPQRLDFTFRIDRLHLLRRTEDGTWTEHQTFMLG